jgi:arsenate reductase
MSLTIYHNPRCSKSRKTLAIIEEAGIEPGIVLYLEDTPGAADILDMASKLGKSVADLLRRGESTFKEATDLPDLNNDAALAAWVAAHPIVLERPIVVDTASGKAVIGRPPENVKELLSDG